MRHLKAMILAGAAIAATTAAPAVAATRAEILSTMKRATHFMVDKVADHGGYVWFEMPDKSRRWGEMEAYPTMIWVQPPGTGTMGHLYMDAYHATGDDYYYQAATKAADALVAGQLPSGGWHYFIDFGGEASTRKWYATIGKNAWRLEEFQHYWGNATFDDAGTSEAMQLLLRIYAEKHDQKYWAPLQKALNFVLKSQYANGGWPQRYPHTDDYIDHGRPDYTSFITFNDDVAGENIRFLIQYYQVTGDARVLDPIHRAMDVYVRTQQPAPQAGWGLQYTTDLKPAGARTYEPTAIVTHTTYSNIKQLMEFYRLTGDPKYLAGIPAALDWLDSVKSPPELNKDGKTYPTFLEIGTNKPMYVHRRGSDVVNGEYYVDDNPANTIGHYSSFRHLDVPALRREYEALKATPPEIASKGSPLKATGRQPLDRYYLDDIGPGADSRTDPATSDPDALVTSLNAAGWWPSQLKMTSHPYTHDGSKTAAPGDYATTRVGDDTDTSPYVDPKPAIGIATGVYVAHMERLIAALDHAK